MRTKLSGVIMLAVATGGLTPTPSLGEVDLSWAPEPRVLTAGTEFEIALWATGAAGVSQSISAMDVLLSWDPQVTMLLGVDNNGPYNWLQSGFPADDGLDGLNNTFLDGDAKYTALAAFGSPAIATGDGLLVTTFRFMALGETNMSHVVIEPQLGDFSFTRVFGADFPNQNVTGALNNAELAVILPVGCDGDGDIDFHEFYRLQACFTGQVGPIDPPAYPQLPGLCCSVFDYDDDGDVDLANVSFFQSILTGPGS